MVRLQNLWRAKAVKTANDGGHSCVYIRGPGGFFEVNRSAWSMLEVAKRYFQRNKHFEQGPIYVAGYSRGGFAAIEFAKWLNIKQHNVEAMFLFDAVAKDSTVIIDGPLRDKLNSIVHSSLLRKLTSLSGLRLSDIMSSIARSALIFDPIIFALYNPNIPPNVQNAYHALRDPRIMSRWYFGNCGTSGANLILQRFPCTHSAMGGQPWAGDHPLRYIGPSIRQGSLSLFLPDTPTQRGPADPWNPLLNDWINSKQNYPLNYFVPTITAFDDFNVSNQVWNWMSQFFFKHHVLDLSSTPNIVSKL